MEISKFEVFIYLLTGGLFMVHLRVYSKEKWPLFHWITIPLFWPVFIIAVVVFFLAEKLHIEL